MPPAVLQALSPTLRRGPAFSAGTHDSDTAGGIATSRHAAQVAPVGGPATSGRSNADSGDSRTSQSDASAGQGTSAAPAAGAPSYAGVADATALTAAGAIGAAASRPASTETVGVAAQVVTLADVADKMMYQVVQTIHSFETAAGPSMEARISDPTIGDVRMVVTGRAGEIVQAELVVRDRITADAMTAAAARMHSSGDELAGVTVTVRAEGGNSSTSGRSGSNPFEAGGWASNGYAAGNDSNSGGNHGHGLGNGDPATSGNGANGQSGNGSGDVLRATPKPVLPVLPTRPEPVRTNQPSPRTPTSRGPSLDVMA